MPWGCATPAFSGWSLCRQALRVALPSLANEYISIVKLSSLVSVISLTEILMVGQRLYSQNFLVMETMAAVAFYYVFIVTVFDFLLKLLEKRLDVTQRKTAHAGSRTGSDGGTGKRAGCSPGSGSECSRAARPASCTRPTTTWKCLAQ